MCSDQFHFILAFFSSKAPFGFVQLAPYREGVKVSGNNQSQLQRSDERVPLTRSYAKWTFFLRKIHWAHFAKCLHWKMNWWQLANDIDRVPCSSLASDCRHWRRAKPSSSEGLYGGRPTFFAHQSTLFIDLWFFMAACHTTFVKSLNPSLGIA